MQDTYPATRMLSSTVAPIATPASSLTCTHVEERHETKRREAESMCACVCRYGVADRYCTGVGCDGDDDEHESEGDDELEEEGLSCAQCGDSHPAGVEGVEDGLEGEGRGGRAQHLGQYVSGDMRPREMAGGGERDSDGRVQMGAGDVADGDDDDANGESG